MEKYAPCVGRHSARVVWRIAGEPQMPQVEPVALTFCLFPLVQIPQQDISLIVAEYLRILRSSAAYKFWLPPSAAFCGFPACPERHHPRLTSPPTSRVRPGARKPATAS